MAQVLSRYQHVIIVIASCLTVVGCTGQVPPPQATTAELPNITLPPQPASPTAPATQTPAPVVTVITETPVRPVPTTRIPRPTMTKPWTPVPTLPAEQAAQALLELYEGEAGCALPCWWGIVPGQTTWADARDQLGPLGTVWGPYKPRLGSRFDFAFAVPPSMQALGWFEVDLSVRAGRVVGINLNSSAIRRSFDYLLAGWLQALGVPEEVWLFVQFDSMGLPHYDLDLFYSTFR